MDEWISAFKDVIPQIAESKVYIGVGCLALFAASSIIPKVGIGRAITLSMNSWPRTTIPLSVRSSDVLQLNGVITSLAKGSYITIIGGKGYGKTCMLNTTLNNHCGVVKFSVR